MTYVAFLEYLAKAENIESKWKACVPAEKRKRAGEAMIKFIKEEGRYCSGAILDRLDPVYEGKFNHPKYPLLRQYYCFPRFSSKVLKDIKNLEKLYKFFFVPKTVVTTTKFE